MKTFLVILSLLIPSFAYSDGPFTNFISGLFSNKDKKDLPPVILMEEILSLNGSCFEKELNNNFIFGNITSSIYSRFHKKVYKKPSTFIFEFYKFPNPSIDVNLKPHYCKIQYPPKIKINETMSLEGNCYRSVYNHSNEDKELYLKFTASCKIKIWNIRDCFRKSEFNKYNNAFKNKKLDCDIPKIERDNFRKETKSYWLNSVKK